MTSEQIKYLKKHKITSKTPYMTIVNNENQNMWNFGYEKVDEEDEDLEED